MRSLLSPLALLIFATVVFFLRAIPYKVSPLATVYFELVVFLAYEVDFFAEAVDFLGELLVVVVFFGVEEETDEVVFVLLKA